MRILPSFPNSKSAETDMRKVTVGLVTVSPCDGASMKMCWAKDSPGASTAAIKSARWHLVFMAKPPLSGRFTNCPRDADRGARLRLSRPANRLHQLRAPARHVESRGDFLRRGRGQRELRVSQLDDVPHPGLVTALGQTEPDARILQRFARGNQSGFRPAQEKPRLLHLKPHRLSQAIALRLDRDQVVIRLARLRFAEQPLEDVPLHLQLGAPIPGEAVERLTVVGEAGSEKEAREICSFHRVDHEALSTNGLLDAGEFRPGFQGSVEQRFSRLVLARERPQS